MIFDTLHLGYNKNLDENEIKKYLDMHKVVIYKYEDQMYDRKWLSIENESYYERGFVAFGSINEFDEDILEEGRRHFYGVIFPFSQDEYDKRKKEDDRGKELIQGDINFWIDFFTGFVERFGSVAFYGAHPSMVEEIKIKPIKISEFNQDLILNLDIYEMLIIE